MAFCHNSLMKTKYEKHFDDKMQSLQNEFAELLKAEAASKDDLLTVLKELGYEIKL